MMITEQEILDEKLVQLTPDKLWFQRPVNIEFLKKTEANKLAFTWIARHVDGTVERQYDDLVEITRAVMDKSFVPNIEHLRSVAKLNWDTVEEFTLMPIAITREHCPWFQMPFTLRPRLDKGERVNYYWETDFQPQTGFTVRRHVLGIVPGSLLILSPTGTQILSNTTDLSIDGE